jgi:hypothetical protein
MTLNSFSEVFSAALIQTTSLSIQTKARSSRWLLLFLCFSCAALPANAANHYIRAGASGSGAGTDWTNACTDFTGSCAVSSMVRGDVYYIGTGSYGSYNFNSAVSGTSVITIKKAIATDHGTDTGWSSSYGDGEANFGPLTFSTAYWVFDGQTGGGPGSWTTGFGFRVTHTTTHAVQIPRTNNITLRHLELQGNSTDGVQGFRLTAANNVTISYYYTENIGNCPFFLVPVSNFVAEYGYVGRYYGSSTNHSEIASIWGGVTNSTTFRYSVFTSVTSTGGLMWDNHEDHTASLNVYGNVFYQSSSSGAWDNNANGLIGGWTGGNGEDCYHLRVYNNTFYNTSGRIFTTFITRSGDNIAENNVFYNSASPAYDDVQTHDYNHYINSGGTHSEAQGASANSGDPFVNAAGLDFRLTADTPPGLSLAAPYGVDPSGAIRGSSGIWDRGAFQFVGASTGPKPPTSLITTVR